MAKYDKSLRVGGVHVCLVFRSFTQVDTHTADAKTVKYKNCKALNKVYKGGVAKSKNTKNKGGKTKYKPYVSKALYQKNMRLDRDKDGIACER
ncbi:Excalibur calcium-binding domain protein [Bacillus safensis]|uniref:excalibur calcium-binding domain-containing protein n=1 Tax=Bacillus safensis TaxID=561879 RepID=UPI0006A8F32C|nr:excalibur calcium-binding domain-containing protein [Bacillus safensis]CUB21017.1 Excalibur calcium-binding domain protein [Bacillus safensis]